MWQKLLQSIAFFLHGQLLVTHVPEQLHWATVLVGGWEGVELAAEEVGGGAERNRYITCAFPTTYTWEPMYIS